MGESWIGAKNVQRVERRKTTKYICMIGPNKNKKVKNTCTIRKFEKTVGTKKAKKSSLRKLPLPAGWKDESTEKGRRRRWRRKWKRSEERTERRKKEIMWVKRVQNWRNVKVSDNVNAGRCECRRNWPMNARKKNSRWRGNILRHYLREKAKKK